MARSRTFAPWARPGLVALVAFGSIVHVTAQVAGGGRVDVSGERPVAKALAVLERLCRCPFSYEDPEWAPDDLEERATPVGQRYQSPKRLEVTYQPPAEGELLTSEQRASAVESLLNTVEAAERRRRFRLVRSDRMVHVVPVTGSLLDRVVTLELGLMPMERAVDTFLEKVGPVNGKPITSIDQWFRSDGRVPQGGLLPSNGPAWRVLEHLLGSTGRKISWELISNGAGHSLRFRFADPGGCTFKPGGLGNPPRIENITGCDRGDRDAGDMWLTAPRPLPSR